MCGTLPKQIAQNNIIFSQNLMGEEDEILSEAELKALKKDTAFMRIWDGGVIAQGTPIRVKSVVYVDERGRLYLNGRRFTRSSWSWRPPPIIRHQGRIAKDYPDPMNEHPWITIIDEKGNPVKQDKCTCGGSLQKDQRGYLYCTKCNIIYE
jgi:hypothetical protein